MAHKLLAAFLLATIFNFAAIAEDPAVKAEADKIYNTVLSPYCPGRLLSHCPSGSADKLKKRIYSELSNGDEPEVVKDRLYAEFGDDIRAAPTFSGFGIVGWLGPAVFLIIGLGLIIRFVRSQKNN